MIEIIILSLIQGVAEFIPISSSSHLILASEYFDFKNQSLSIDVSLHIGSFIAVVLYFYKDILNFYRNKILFFKIFISSIPVMLIGYFLVKSGEIERIRNLETIAWTTLIFGILLFIADKNRFDKKISSNLNLRSILFISLFQILSLVPGVSRAGITITAARILRFNRFDSSKISFLLSIPALGGASFLGLKDAFSQSVEFNYLVIIAIVASFIFSFMTVKFFLIYINKFSMNAFVIYRILIAMILFAIIY